MGHRETTAYMEIMVHCSAEHAGVMARAIPIPPDGLSGTAYVDWVLAISGGGPL